MTKTDSDRLQKIEHELRDISVTYAPEYSYPPVTNKEEAAALRALADGVVHLLAGRSIRVVAT